MPHIVLKLEGNALSDGAGFQRAIDTIRTNPHYSQIVPSAPAGSEWSMTTLLKRLEHVQERDVIYWELGDKLSGIIQVLEIESELGEWARLEIAQLSEHIVSAAPDWSYVESRGTYWSAIILAKKLKIPVKDPADLVRFTPGGELDEVATRKAFAQATLPDQFVMPGSYGSDADGRIRVFPKNGSYVAAAVLAAQTRAKELHVARRGVAGIPFMNPRIRTGSPDALRTIDQMSFEHARCLSSRSDCGILYRNALKPLERANIPVRVFNLFDQAKPGTRICSSSALKHMRSGKVIGIAEQPGYTVFTLKRARPRKRRAIMEGIVSVLKKHGLDLEHEALGRDAVSFSVRNDALTGRQEEVARSLRRTLRALVTYESSEGVICLVGKELGGDLIRFGSLLVALGTHVGSGAGKPDKEVRLSFMVQTACGSCVLLGIESSTLRIAVNRLYDEIIRNQR